MSYTYSPEVTVALSSLAVALITTLFVLYQASLTRIHNRLSVRPQLSMEIFTSTDEHASSVEMRVTNIGLGPALIKNHDVYLDGNHIGGTKDINLGRAAFKNLMPKIENGSIESSIFSMGTALRSGESRSLMKYKFSKLLSTNGAMMQSQGAIIRVDAKIDYECMYGLSYSLDTRRIPIAGRI